MAQLKQQLKKSEVDREELSAELRECRKIKVEPRVSGTDDCEYTQMFRICSSTLVAGSYYTFSESHIMVCVCF